MWREAQWTARRRMKSSSRFNEPLISVSVLARTRVFAECQLGSETVSSAVSMRREEQGTSRRQKQYLLTHLAVIPNKHFARRLTCRMLRLTLLLFRA